VTGFAGEMDSFIKINSRIKRMDSLMVAANIKAKPTGAAIYLYLKPCNISRKKGRDDYLTGMEHHYDPGSRVIYYSQNPYVKYTKNHIF